MSLTQNPTRRADPLEIVARDMCLAAGIDPDSRVAKPGSPRGMPDGATSAFAKPQMEGWLQERGVMLSGGGVDESPMA